MANDLTSNPWVIDTASATAVTTEIIRVEKLVLEGAAAGQQVIVQHANGKTFWDRTSVGGEPVESDFDGIAGNCRGMIVPTLGGGKLYVHYV